MLKPCIGVCRRTACWDCRGRRSLSDGYIRTVRLCAPNWPTEKVLPLLPSGHPDLILMYLLRKGGSCSFLISMSKFSPPAPSVAFPYFLLLPQFHIHFPPPPPPPPLYSSCLYVSCSLLRLIPEGWHFHFLSLLFSYSAALLMLPGSFRFILIQPPRRTVFTASQPPTGWGVSLIALHLD